MEGDHEAQMKDCFNQLLNLFPEPVVFVHYNYTESKLLQELFGRFEDIAPNHSYCVRLPQVGCDLQVIKSSRSKSSQVGVFGDLNNSSQVKSSQEQVEIVT